MFDQKWAVLAILILLFPFIGKEAGGEKEVVDLGAALGTMFAHIEEMGSGSVLYPPIDGTSILTRVLRGEVEPAPTTRADDPPSSWDLLRTGTYCEIYIEQGGSIANSELDELVAVFDTKIYPNSTFWFHPVAPPSSVEIRIYDMGDGEGGVGGFFIASPLHRDDLYLDLQDISSIDEILAHEFEHMLHYDLDPNEAIWLDEGLADLSVRISLGPGTPAVQGHIYYYEQRPENDLISWDDGTHEDNIADYGAAYSYIAYLADHFGEYDLTSALVSEPLNSMEAIDKVLSDLGYSEDGLEVHRRVKVANLLDDPLYGGRIYDQGLIDISVSSLRADVDSYPFHDQVSSTAAYAGYYYTFTGGAPGLSITVNSTVEVHTSVIGISGGVTSFSGNITSTPGTGASLDLTGFGSIYDTFHAIPSAAVSGGSFEIDISKKDGIPPVTTVYVDPPLPDGINGYYVTPPAIVLSRDAGDLTYFSWDGGDDQVYSEPLTAPEGEHTLSFYSSDLGLNEERREMTFRVDTIPPATELSIVPSEPDGLGGTYITSPVVTLSPEEGSSAFYDLGDGETAYTVPFNIPHGSYEMEYWSIDPAGNEEGREVLVVVVDVSDPAASLILDPLVPDGERGYYRTMPTVSFDLDPSHKLFYSMNGSDYLLYSQSFTLVDGEYEISYYAVTTSGREGPVKSSALKVDSTPPVLQAVTDPEQSEGWTKETMYLTLLTDDPMATLRVMLGIDGPYDYSGPILLTDGNYDISCWAIDLAGNRADGPVIEVRIDSSPPDTSLVISRQPDHDIWFHDTPPLIHLSGQGTILSEERYYYSLNDGDFLQYDGTSIVPDLGINTLSYYGIDAVGNRESIKSRQIGLDLKPPLPELMVNRTIIGGGGPVTFFLEGSQDDVGIGSFRVFFGDGSDSGWITSDRIVHNYTALGEYRPYVEVMDFAGRVGKSDDDILIEVLTPEEARRRLAPEDEGYPYLLYTVAMIILLVIIFLMIFIVVRYRRDRPVEVQWIKENSEEKTGSIIIKDEDEEDWGI